MRIRGAVGLLLGLLCAVEAAKGKIQYLYSEFKCVFQKIFFGT